MGWQASWAFLAALAGQAEELAGFLANLPSVLPRLPVDLQWPVTHFCLGAAQGFAVQNPEVAAALYEVLLPHRSLHATSCVGYWSPIEVALGVLARMLGNTDGALVHHESAAQAIEACGAARARARARALNGYQWVVALLARDAPGDRERASELRQQTLEWCRARGYRTFERKLEELLI